MKAYEILQSCKNPANRYKLAQLCYKLCKLEEAESALLDNKNILKNRFNKEENSSQSPIPNGAAGYYLLGMINRKKDKDKDAWMYFRKALDLDPTLWCAFEMLAEYDPKLELIEGPSALEAIFPTGKQIHVMHYNKLDQNPPFKQCTSEVYNMSYGSSKGDVLMKTPYGKDADASNETKENLKSVPDNKQYVCSPIHERDSEDPQEHHTPTGSGLNPNYITPIATGKNSRRLNNIENNAPHQLHHESRLSGVSPSGKIKDINDSSLCGHGSITSDPYLKPVGSGTADQVIKPFKVNTPSAVGNPSNSKSSMSSKISKSRDEYGTENIDLMWLLRKIGFAYVKQIKYECMDAIAAYQKLPRNQYNTGWVLTQVGCCFLDVQDYQAAESVFQTMRKLEPHTIEGLHHYSICLWHLKKQVELCSLSNYCLKKNTLTPETWIAVGNCYSLQNENEAAIRFFKRAIQLDRNCGMAFTLCGHEYFEIEDFEESERQYRKGFTVDRRNYKAWWGVGNIHLKQEKYDKALRTFNYAAQIYPKSSFIHTYIGMALMHSNQTEKALLQFELAQRLNPNAPLNSFMRIQALTNLDRNDEALDLLIELIKKHPKESSLHIHKGKLMKKLGKKEEALKDYNRALDLNPKDSNMVKSLTDKLNSSNDFNEDAEI